MGSRKTRSTRCSTSCTPPSRCYPGRRWWPVSAACSISIKSNYLYDLTSTYFEGVGVRNDKAKRGYSRDHRPDCKQLVVGLVLNRDGFAITHEIFAGNAQESAPRLPPCLIASASASNSKLRLDRGDRSRHGVRRKTSPTSSMAQAPLHRRQGRQPERDRWLAEFDDTDGFTLVLRQPSSLNPAQKKTSIEVKICTGDDDGEDFTCSAAASNASPKIAPSA